MISRTGHGSHDALSAKRTLQPVNPTVDDRNSALPIISNKE